MSVLYVVATPIGNLGDISRRACQILSEVDLIAAEDTRRTKRLLDDIGITTKLTSYHVHNEARTTEALMLQLENGADIALVSDAGTPLISDPGFLLVKEALFRGISVVPIPGPSAVTTALSVAGIPTTRFIFEGFAPAKSTGRKAFFETFVRESRTIVYFEAPHRIAKSLSDLGLVLGEVRQITVCREMTKTFEQVYTGSIRDVVSAIASNVIPEKGEFVVVVSGAVNRASKYESSIDEERLLAELLRELPPAKAASIVARLTRSSRSDLYSKALEMKQDL